MPKRFLLIISPFLAALAVTASAQSAEDPGLTVHRETKELPIYALIPAKGGPKLHKAEPNGNTNMRGENGSFVFRNMSMPQFAEDLST